MIIVHLIVNDEVRQFCLAGSTAYSLGRRNCHILLPTHPSISRHHATITVLPTPASEVDDFSVVPTVLIADVSKHGTTVNGELLSSTEANRPLHVGDLVAFGTCAKMRLLHAPVIVCPSPSLSLRQRKEVLDDVCRLGGALRDSPVAVSDIVHAGVSPLATLMIADTISHDPTCLKAVLEGYTVVRPGYLHSLYTAVREAPGTEIASLPNPHAFDVPLSDEIAGTRYMRPERALFGPGDFVHAPRPSTGVFRSRHVVFFDEDDTTDLSDVVRAAEGSTSAVSVSSVLEWTRGPTDSVLPLRGLLPEQHCHGLNVSFVLSPARFATLEAAVVLRADEDKSESLDADPLVSVCHRLFKMHFCIVSSENLAKAIVSMDPSETLLNHAAPGVLMRGHMQNAVVDSDEDIDSNATTDGIAAFRFSHGAPRALEPSTDVSKGTSKLDSSVGAANRHQVPAQPRSPRGGPSDERDLYEEWKSFRRRDSTVPNVPAPSESSPQSRRSRSPNASRRSPTPGSARKTRKNPSLPDFRSEFEQKLEPMRRQVLHIADKAVDQGKVSATDASLLDTIHQRVVNYLDWIRVEEKQRGLKIQWSIVGTAESILHCIEATLTSCTVDRA